MIKIIVDNKIRIPLKDLNTYLIEEIKNNFTYPDPMYFKKKALGFRVRNPLIYNFKINEKRNVISISRGGVDKIKKVFNNNCIDYEFIDHRIICNKINVNLKDDIIIFEYQKKIVKQLLSKTQYLLKANTGSGKTVMALLLISCLKQPTLIFLHTYELFDQWRDNIKKYLNYNDEIGEIRANKFSIKPITLAMVQTLSKLSYSKWNIINRNFGCVINDEGNHIPAMMFKRVMNAFKAKYRFALSCEFKRKDGREFLIYDSVSHNIAEVLDTELVEEGRFVDVKVEFIPTNFYYNILEGEKIDWNDIVDNIVKNEERNNLIIKNVKKDVKNGRINLILTTRVSHCLELYNLIKKDVKAGIIIGKMKKEQRQKVINHVRQGQIKALFATTNLASEGLDIPILSSLHLPIPSNNFVLLKQMTGRIRRVYQNKNFAKVYDYVDIKVPFLLKIAKRRKFYYTKFDYRIINEDVMK
ncbi:MAG: DEAD/DEAH box helicase [Promethearchaeota archaeon]